MKQIFNSSGRIIVEEVPAPSCGENQVLVQNRFSVISAGTEGRSLEQSQGGLSGIVSRVKNRPELIKKAIDMARREGLGDTWKAVRGQGVLIPLGYSSSGIVLEVGSGINDIAVGDRVTCGGTGYASHAEVIVVPRNLVCKIPQGLELDEAAFTTLGAIAMQGTRRAQVQLGDKVAVIGLGLVGQLTCQLLKAAGAFVFAIDLIKDRVELARELGADVCLVSSDNLVAEVLNCNGGSGVDAVIIAADTPDSKPVNRAMQMARKKGKIVVVGAVGMELDRSPFYEKELDFLISSSYGPGRYDPVYEEKGIDYPPGYVRWTENRNMQEFLNLLARKRVNVRRLINRVFPLDKAGDAYAALTATTEKPVGVLFQYPAKEAQPPPSPVVELRPLQKAVDRINVAIIGAGSFARAYHLPNLKKLPFFSIRAIIARTGVSAKSAAERFGAQYCSTDYREALNDKDVDMVLIATRHDLHAPLIIEAAKAGKSIFTEKPIALTYEQCKDVYETVSTSQVNLCIGFNRRFSPLAQRMKRLTEKRQSPMVINIRVNSAGMTGEHWINDPEEGGGAIVGEACHFFDFISWLVNAEPKRIHAQMISSQDPSLIDANNMVCTLSYGDGSIASLTYLTIGNESFPKERIEVFVDGGVVAIDDFRELVIAGLPGVGAKLPRIEKGQLKLLEEYGRFLRGEEKNRDLPMLLDGIAATVCSLKAMESLKTGEVQEFRYPW